MSRIFGALLLLLAAGCAASVELPPVPHYGPTDLTRLHYQAVIVAGDASINAFDNAADRMARDLAAHGDVTLHRYSARPADHRPPDIALATVSNVLDGIAGLHPAPGEGCLVYATAHGAPNAGLYFPAGRNDAILDPDRLDRALALGCGNAPSIIILSGCFSGGYLRAPMLRDNRIILTAARPDRPSFGCGAGNEFTEFDRCILTTLEFARTNWQDTFTDTRACVTTREAELHQRPSEPQAWFGPSVAALPLPTR